MPKPEINSRQDFFSMLARTAAEIDGFVEREPSYPVWGLLQRQLHAMEAWTANGADPTLDQQQRVSIGLLAARELEPAQDEAMEDLITRLHLLNYYWRRWPAMRQPPVPTWKPGLEAPPPRPRVGTGGHPFRSMNPMLIVSFVLFAAACWLPALEFKNSDGTLDVMLGLRALVVGWSGFFAAIFAWYANPFWLLGVILLLLRKPVPAAVAGIVAVVIASSVFPAMGRELPGDEGNVTKTTIFRLLPGCYVWMASMLALPFSLLFRKSA